jgi:hypothetical protein
MANTDISHATAREELAKFFAIADLADKAPEMFSEYIDAEWHRLLNDTDEYKAFCSAAVGHPVGHQPDKGFGTPSWLRHYHANYGQLPAVWFADATGTVNRELYAKYLTVYNTDSGDDAAPPPDAEPAETGLGKEMPPLITAWDCTPTTGDPDFFKPTPGILTAWDCTPTTGDPDLVSPITLDELVIA